MGLDPKRKRYKSDGPKRAAETGVGQKQQDRRHEKKEKKKGKFATASELAFKEAL
jgi:hypothetical protein